MKDYIGYKFDKLSFIKEINSLKTREKNRKLKHLSELKKLIDINKQNMYLWGFLWADSYFKTEKSISLEIVKVDLEDIKDTIPKYFTFYERNRKNRKPQATAYCSNSIYIDFLKQNGFDTKQNPSKLFVDSEFSFLWFRGFIDGDGCWYINKKNYCYQFSISSNYNQNWSFVEDLFNKIDVDNYQIQRIVTKNNHSYSSIRVCSKESVCKIRDYIYQSDNDIGLSRKREKAFLF